MHDELHIQSSHDVENDTTRVAPSGVATSGRWIVGGSAALALGSILPWATIHASFLGTYSVGGLHAGGVITLPVAATIAYLGRNTRRAPLTTVARRSIPGGLAVAALIVFLNFTQIVNVAGKDTSGLVQVSPGFGLFVAAAGIVATTVGVFRNKTAHRAGVWEG